MKERFAISFMVKELAVMPTAAGVPTRMRVRPARAAAILGLL